MARQEKLPKPEKVLWICPDCDARDTDGGRRYEADSRREGTMLDCPGCWYQADCPGPVKYERKDSE